MNLMPPALPLDAQLEAQLRALLEVARRSRQKPSLSLEELTIAIITLQPELTLIDVQRHILTAFKYFNEASVECSITRGYQGSLIISKFNATFSTLLHRFDIPIDVYCVADEHVDDDDDELYVSPAAAQIYLQDHLTAPHALAKNKRRPFPFLKLPIEIRLQIYGHVVGLPKSGVAVRQGSSYSRKKEVVVRSKEFDSEMQLSDWEDTATPAGVRARWNNFEYRYRNDRTFKCPDLHTHLALLRVNKEIFNEAMPVFYSVNSFVCSDLYHLEDFLATLAPERREQLRHISFFYTKHTHGKAPKAFKMLGEIKKLKRLDIMIDEGDFVGLTKSKGERVFPDLLRLPGFHTLRSIRALKTVQFHGKCDTIREALQSWVVDSKGKAAKPKKAKKAKAMKKAKTMACMAEEAEEDEEAATPEAGEYEADSKSPPDMDEAPDLIQYTDPTFPFLPNHYRAPPSSRPSTPPPRMAEDLLSPFKFNPSNSESHFASRFQTLSPLDGGKQATAACFDEGLVASGSSTPSLSRREKEYGKSEPTQANQVAPKSAYQQGHAPVPCIATRLLLHGPGHMFDWRPMEGGASMWNQSTVAPSSLMRETFEASTGSVVDTEDPFVVDQPLKMEDLLAEHDKYMLFQ